MELQQKTEGEYLVEIYAESLRRLEHHDPKDRFICDCCGRCAVVVGEPCLHCGDVPECDPNGKD